MKNILNLQTFFYYLEIKQKRHIRFLIKKVSEFVSTIKSKFEGLFKIFKKDNAKDEDTKIDDDKRIFNLKTLIHKLRKKKKDDTEN